MDRRDFVRLSAAALGAGFALSPEDAPGQSPAPGEPRPLLDSPPVLQNPGPDAMTVIVAVSKLSTVWVEYGPTPRFGSRADNSRHGLLTLNGRVHRARLEGLKPGMKYYYRVGACPIDFKNAYKITRGAAEYSPVSAFTTLDAGHGSTASFSIINDTHEKPETLRGVMGLLAARPPDLTFWNGDIFDDVRSDQQVVEQVLRPAGVAYASAAPMCFVSGNHDVRGIHARWLDGFIDVPQGRRHYVVRQGPVAFIVLDTGEDKPDSHAVYAGLSDFEPYRARQRVWLEGALASEEVRSAAFRVAVLHIPLWGKACSDDSRRHWHDLLAGAGLHAAISGHVHEYKFSPPDGDHPYAQIVGGGPKPETATVVEGRAEGRELSLIVRDLSGTEIGNHPIRA